MDADTAYLASIAASLLEKQALPGSVEASRLRDAASVAYRQGQIMEQAQAQEQKQSSSPPTTTASAMKASPSDAVCPWCYGTRRDHYEGEWAEHQAAHMKAMASTIAPTPASLLLATNAAASGPAGQGCSCAEGMVVEHVYWVGVEGPSSVVVTNKVSGASWLFVRTPAPPASETSSISQRPALPPSVPAETPAPSASSESEIKGA